MSMKLERRKLAARKRRLINNNADRSNKLNYFKIFQIKGTDK